MGCFPAGRVRVAARQNTKKDPAGLGEREGQGWEWIRVEALGLGCRGGVRV